MFLSFLLQVTLYPFYMGLHESKGPDFRADLYLRSADLLVVLLRPAANLYRVITGRLSVNGWRIVVEHCKRTFVLVDGVEAPVADGQLILWDAVGLAGLVLEALAGHVAVEAFDALFHIIALFTCSWKTGWRVAPEPGVR